MKYALNCLGGSQSADTHKVTTSSQLNMIITSINYQGGGGPHRIGEVNPSGVNYKQKTENLAHNFIVSNKWPSLSHMDNDAIRKFQGNDNLGWVYKQSGGDDGVSRGSRKEVETNSVKCLRRQ